MANIKKIVKRTAIAFLGLLIGIPLLLVAINAFDEDLKPEAIAFVDFSDDDVPAEQNGFFAWVGLTVPIGADPHTRGLQIVAQINEWVDTAPHELVDKDIYVEPSALQFTGTLSGLCSRDMTGCLDRYRAKTPDIDQWVRENRILLDRYRALYGYPHFRETIKPRFGTPIFTNPSAVAGLIRAQHAIRALHGDISGALGGLREDIVFWRHVLSESHSFTNKLLAVALIRSNAQLISEIVVNLPTDRRAITLASEAIRPLTDQERDLSRVFRHEFGSGQHFFTALPSEHNAGCVILESIADCAALKLTNTLLFKQNATINLYFEYLKMLAAASRLSAPLFLKWASEQRASVRTGVAWPWSWDLGYNPSGKILSTMLNLAHNGHIGRIHNLDGFLRLVSLQIAIKQAAIRDADIPEFLGRARPELHNPYTGEPMQWDNQNRTLYFNGMNEKTDEELLGKRIELRL